MTRSTLITVLALTAAAGSAAPAAAATRCVGSAPGCHKTLQGALDAARDGDTIKLGAGTVAGGVQIDRSVKVVGAGAGRTTIRGGGPVATVGSWGDATPPTVSITGVKIIGGRTRTGPEGEDFVALGGGVLVPAGADFGVGATLTIRDSVISGNARCRRPRSSA